MSHICEICQGKFRSLGGLALHRKSCNKPRTEFPCTHGCGKILGSQSSFTSHIYHLCPFRPPVVWSVPAPKKAAPKSRSLTKKNPIPVEEVIEYHLRQMNPNVNTDDIDLELFM